MAKLIAVLCLLFAALGLAVYQVDSGARARSVAESERALAARAQFLANALDHNLEFRLVETFTFAALPSFRAFAASDENARSARAAVAQSELQAIVAADTKVRAASIVDVAGKVVLTTDGSMNANWGERLFIREALAGHLHASVPALDFGEISQYYSAPLLNNAGSVSGALVIRVAVQELWNSLSAQQDILVVDENGVRLADRTNVPQTFYTLAALSPDAAAVLIAEKRYGSETTVLRASNLAALDMALKNKQRAITYQDAGGQTVHAAIAPMKVNPWSVVTFEPESVILAQSVDVLWDEIKVAMAAFVVGSGVITAVLLWARSKPELPY